jgi:predicted amidohydrolase
MDKPASKADKKQVEKVDKLVVATIQQRVRLPQSSQEYQEDLRRFLRSAESKQARLVVFPELAAMSLFLPMLAGWRISLLKRAELGRQAKAAFRQRIVGAFSNRLLHWFGANVRKSVAALLDVEGERAWKLYSECFSALASEFQVTLVAPSAYLPDPRDGVVRNLTGVFGPDGKLLGHQAKVMPYAEDIDIAQFSTRWDVIASEVGRLGLMLGGDVLYPEAGRVLAYQGAEVLVAQGACLHPAMYNKLRAGILARMQDNQLYSVASFMVGVNAFARSPKAAFMGKAAIFAPQELTPRYNGVLVEMGSPRSEGVLTAEWDFAALRQLWKTSETPVRRQLPAAQVTQILASLYSQLQSQPPLLELANGEAEDAANRQAESVLELSELPVIGSVSSPWPPPKLGDNDESLPLVSSNRPATSLQTIEDETDEMDVI